MQDKERREPAAECIKNAPQPMASPSRAGKGPSRIKVRMGTQTLEVQPGPNESQLNHVMTLLRAQSGPESVDDWYVIEE